MLGLFLFIVMMNDLIFNGLSFPIGPTSKWKLYGRIQEMGGHY